MIDHETPLLDTLNAHRLTNLLGAVAAEQCATMEELRPHWPGYARRAAHYRDCLASVEAQIAAVAAVPIDHLAALKTRRRQCEAMIDRKPAERRAWADKAMRIQARIEAMGAGL